MGRDLCGCSICHRWRFLQLQHPSEIRSLKLQYLHSLAISTISGVANEKFCITVRGNSVKSRDTTPHTLSEYLFVAGSSDMNRISHSRDNCWFIKAGHSTAKIHMLLRLLKVDICRVYHVKKLFEETGNICDHL